MVKVTLPANTLLFHIVVLYVVFMHSTIELLRAKCVDLGEEPYSFDLLNSAVARQNASGDLTFRTVLSIKMVV